MSKRSQLRNVIFVSLSSLKLECFALKLKVQINSFFLHTKVYKALTVKEQIFKILSCRFVISGIAGPILAGHSLIDS